MHWLYVYWYAYQWVSLKGNGPENIVAVVLGAILTAIIVPRVRHWFERHVESIKAHITSQHLATRLHHEALHADLHARLDAAGVPPLSTPAAPPSTKSLDQSTPS